MKAKQISALMAGVLLASAEMPAQDGDSADTSLASAEMSELEERKALYQRMMGHVIASGAKQLRPAFFCTARMPCATYSCLCVKKSRIHATSRLRHAVGLDFPILDERA